MHCRSMSTSALALKKKGYVKLAVSDSDSSLLLASTLLVFNIQSFLS